MLQLAVIALFYLENRVGKSILEVRESHTPDAKIREWGALQHAGEKERPQPFGSSLYKIFFFPWPAL